MKKLLYTLLAVSMIFSACKKEEDDINNNSGNIVNIPDANFKAYLVGNTAINTNGDTEIQVSEAAAFNGAIDCWGMNIADLTGIEAFTALTTLYCFGNQLTSLDVRNGNNTNLYFSATNNPNLYCIDVDDATWWATANWWQYNIDSWASFSNNCALEVMGCIYPIALNYNSSATLNDGSCNFGIAYVPDDNFEQYLID